MCVYVYIYICMYVYVCVYVYICVCVCIYVCMYVCMYIYVCMCVYVYIYMYVCMCVCVCVCVCASLVAQMLKNLPACRRDLGSIPELGRSPELEKGNVTHSSRNQYICKYIHRISLSIHLSSPCFWHCSAALGS